jgi:hypothetical protein
MTVNALFQLLILLFVEVDLLPERVLILSDKMLGFHEGILLHLVYLQFLKRNIHPFPFELSP